MRAVVALAAELLVADVEVSVEVGEAVLSVEAGSAVVAAGAGSVTVVGVASAGAGCASWAIALVEESAKTAAIAAALARA